VENKSFWQLGIFAVRMNFSVVFNSTVTSQICQVIKEYVILYVMTPLMLFEH